MENLYAKLSLKRVIASCCFVNNNDEIITKKVFISNDK